VTQLRFTPVADYALLVGFDDISEPAEVLGAVQALDRAIRLAQPSAVLETAPALVNLLVRFDPLSSNHADVADVISTLTIDDSITTNPTEHHLTVTYGGAAGPDLDAVAEATGLDTAAVVDAHVARPLTVQMYGFAPGYAYLGDLPEQLHLPRKPQPVRDVPAGSVIIANNQCLVTTITMPTGWWIIGHTEDQVLTPAAARPAIFEPGDLVHFHRNLRA